MRNQRETFDDVAALYDRYLPGAKDKPPSTIPGHVEQYVVALREDARYGPPQRSTVPWQRVFELEEYMGWLGTHSPVRMLSDEDRDAFLRGHESVIARFDGEVTRLHETVLITSRLTKG